MVKASATSSALSDCQLAKAVKAPKKIGNAVKDKLLDTRQKVLKRTLNLLDAHPDFTSDLHDFLCGIVDEKATVETRGAKAFETYVETLADVPGNFWKCFLVSRASVSKERVHPIKGQDTDGFKQISQFITKSTLGLKLGEFGQDKTVLVLGLRERAQHADCDRLLLLPAIIQEDGSLDWGRGVYRTENKDGKAHRFFSQADW